MNQIISKFKKNKEVQNSNIVPKILLIPIIILFIIILSYKIYSVASSNQKDEQMNVTIKAPELAVEKTEEIEKIYVVLETDNKGESKQNSNNSNTSTKSSNVTGTGTNNAKNKKQYSTIATLNIPKLGIEYPILSKTSTELLKIALNKYWGANPNEVGNMCVVGHNYEDSRFFGNLHKMKKGDIIKITDLTGKTLDYQVYKTMVIGPYDTECTSQLTNGHTEITLITCYAGGSKRLAVKARAY